MYRYRPTGARSDGLPVNVSTATTVLTWAMVTLGAAAVVCAVLLKRWAARILVVAVAVLIGVIAFAARQEIAALPNDNPGALCTDGVSWFGIRMSGDAELCAKYR